MLVSIYFRCEKVVYFLKSCHIIFALHSYYSNILILLQPMLSNIQAQQYIMLLYLHLKLQVK